jgi:hypothetical protein
MSDPAFHSARNISLVTFCKEGRAVATTVWHVSLDGKLYRNTNARSGKIKRLRHNPAIRLAPCTLRGTITGT